MKKKKIKFVYVDQWHRGVYTCEEIGQRYVDVDGTLHTMTVDYDEPIEPVSFEFELVSHFKNDEIVEEEEESS